MLQGKVMEFVNRKEIELCEFYELNPCARKFGKPAFNDSTVQERMMKIGIEARALDASTEDHFYLIAVATLQDDHVRNETSRLALST